MKNPFQEEFESFLQCRYTLIWDESTNDYIEPGDVSDYFRTGAFEGIIIMVEAPVPGRNVLTEKSPEARARLIEKFLEQKGFDFYPMRREGNNPKTWEPDGQATTTGFAVMNVSEKTGIEIAERFGLHYVIVIYCDQNLDVRVEAVGLKRYQGMRMIIFKYED